MPKYIVVAEKDGKKRVAQIEPKHLSIVGLQDHLMKLGVAITFTELTPKNTTYKEYAGELGEGEIIL